VPVEHAVERGHAARLDAAAQVAVDVGRQLDRRLPLLPAGHCVEAMVWVCEATYIVPPITSGWLEAFAELSRLKFLTACSRAAIAGIDLLQRRMALLRPAHA
jgi:hypothetical protein